MWSKAIAAVAATQVLGSVRAANSFPQDSDEIEALLFQQGGYRSRGFADIVTPCSNEGAPGFVIAAGMVRTAFHDMAEHNAATGAGGLDASIAYELQGDFAVHNSGPAFNATLSWLYNFYNEKASMSDLIALGLVTSVQSCGGPFIPMKYGRKDATRSGGEDKLPDAGDSADTLKGRFDAMGFTPQDMIKLVACGHTLGGVHIGPNPAIASADAARARSENVLVFDDTDSKFDNNVCSQYVQGTTRNPLVVGRSDLASDKRVFEVDNNKTVKALANSASSFRGACQDVLGRMIEKVPSGVQLSDTIQPYEVRPGQLNINVKGDGPDLDVSGELRIRTTKNSVSSVKIVYTGPADCKTTKCEIQATKAGSGTGFGGERFDYYGFSGTVSSITSFNVVVNGQTYDNGGKGFALNGGKGGAFVQPSSCSLSNGKVTVAVAVPIDSSSSSPSKPSLPLAKRASGQPSCKLTVKSKAVYGQLPKTTSTQLSCSKTCSDELFTYWECSGNADSNAATYGRLETSIDGKVIDSDRSFSGFPSSRNVPKCKGKATTSSSTTTSQSSTSSSLSTTTTSKASAVTTSSSTTSGKSTLTTTTTKCKGRGCDEGDNNTSSTTKCKGRDCDDNQTSSTTTTKDKGGDDHSSTTTKDKDGDDHSSTTTKDKDGDDHGHGTKTTSSKDSDYTPPSWTVWDPAPVPANPTIGHGGSGPTDAPWSPWNGQKALDEVKSIYRDHALIPAPSGGIDGGNKRTHGLNLHITVKIIEVTISAPTLIYPGAPQQTWGGADVPVKDDTPKTWDTVKVADPTKTWGGADVPAASNTWVSVEVPAPSTWKPADVPAADAPSSWKPADVPAASSAVPAPAKDWENVKPSSTYGAPVAKWTGAANSLVARGEVAMMGAAAVIGAFAMVL